MGGLLGYAFAGAAAGVGSGIVEQAKQDRELALRQMGWAHDELMQKNSQDFQSSQTDKTFAHQDASAERQNTWANERAATDNQNQTERMKLQSDLIAGREKETRDYNATLPGNRIEGEDGYVYFQPKGGGPAQRAIDQDGNPIKVGSTADKEAGLGTIRLAAQPGDQFAENGDMESAVSRWRVAGLKQSEVARRAQLFLQEEARTKKGVTDKDAYVQQRMKDLGLSMQDTSGDKGTLKDRTGAPMAPSGKKPMDGSDKKEMGPNPYANGPGGRGPNDGFPPDNPPAKTSKTYAPGAIGDKILPSGRLITWNGSRWVDKVSGMPVPTAELQGQN